MRKWGLKDGRLVRVEDESHGVVCAGCGQPLIAHKGTKRGWYYSHPAGRNSKECLGSAAAVIHKMMLDAFGSVIDYILPASKPVAGGLYAYSGEVVRVDSVTSYKGLIGSGVVLNNRILVYQRGMRFEDEFDVAVEFDTLKWQQNIDNLTYEDIRGYVLTNNSAFTVTHPLIRQAERTYFAYKQQITTPYMVCPASLVIDESRPVITTMQDCKRCTFYAGSGVCLGKGCISDFPKDAFDDKTPVDRYEEYHTSVPLGVGFVKFFDKKPMGTCSCGGDYALCRGNIGQNIACVPRLRDIEEEAAFLRCKLCGRVKSIKCPVCGEKMNVRRSKGKQDVYLQCKAHFTKGEGCNGVLSTLTVWNDENKPKEFADEILAVGDLSRFSNKSEEAVLKVRGKL